MRTFLQVIDQLIRFAELESSASRAFADEETLIVIVEVVVVLALKDEPITRSPHSIVREQKANIKAVVNASQRINA